jgi:hypothetical protein
MKRRKIGVVIVGEQIRGKLPNEPVLQASAKEGVCGKYRPVLGHDIHCCSESIWLWKKMINLSDQPEILPKHGEKSQRNVTSNL